MSIETYYLIRLIVSVAADVVFVGAALFVVWMAYKVTR